VITGDDRWYQVAALLRDAVQAALTVPVKRTGVVPGAIAWDAADCGALYVAWTQTYYSDEFPHRVDAPLGNCAPALSITEFTVQVVRCEPSVDTSRAPVGTAVLDSAAQQLAIDSQQMSAAVLALLCSMTDPPSRIEDFLMGPVLPVGPEGGLIAAELSVAVGLVR
jgi:hypothetical protein